MGAKAPSKLKLRRPQYKCQTCHKQFLSTQALKSHQYCVHRIKKPMKPVKLSEPEIMYPSPNLKLSITVDKSVKNNQQSDQNSSTNSEQSAQNKPTDPLEGMDPLEGVPSQEEERPEPLPHTRRTEFECPQCLKMFVVYFSAFKHIQKFHSQDAKGKHVHPNSPDIIKPVLVEICTQCNRRVRENEYHLCTETIEDVNFIPINCVCSGCKQHFLSVQLFDMHVTGLHCEGIEGMFFPTMNEFLQWKRDMESETKAKYMTLSNTISKQILRCTYFLNAFYPGKEKDNVTHLCPSSIIMKEYSKGIQVHFYKQHFGHPAPRYTIPSKYSKYNMTSMMDKIRGENILPREEDLYVQFKKIMDNVVVDAAKLKISDLKILIGKALDMAKLVTIYAPKDDDETNKPPQVNISDAAISKALEEYSKEKEDKKEKRKPEPPIADNPDNDSPPSRRLRRTPRVSLDRIKTPTIINTPSVSLDKNKTPTIINTPSVSLDRIKTPTIINTPRVSLDRIKTPTIVNTFSLADEMAEKKKTKTPVLSEVESAPKVAAPPKVEIPPKVVTPQVNINVKSPAAITSYSDTYREFLERNFTPKTTPKDTNSKIKVLSRNDINEKVDLLNVNQNVPSLSLANMITNAPIVSFMEEKPLNHQPTTLATDSYLTVKKPTKTYTSNNNTEADTPTPKILKINPNVNISPKSKAKSKKVNVGNKRKKDTKKKNVVKTKIGQFKPSLSPKKPTQDIITKDTSPNTSPKKLKPDFQYEVMEQENDCNILILKI